MPIQDEVEMGLTLNELVFGSNRLIITHLYSMMPLDLPRLLQIVSLWPCLNLYVPWFPINPLMT